MNTARRHGPRAGPPAIPDPAPGTVPRGPTAFPFPAWLGLPLLLTLACCGGGGGTPAMCPLSTSILLVSDPDLVEVHGWTTPECAGRGATVISLRPDLPFANTVRLIIHELGHAIGLAHSPDPDCIMYEDPYLATGFCDGEREAFHAAGIDHLYYVDAVDPRFADALAEAVAEIRTDTQTRAFQIGTAP